MCIVRIELNILISTIELKVLIIIIELKVLISTSANGCM